MIKFKKIIQKALSQAAGAGHAGTLLMGAAGQRPDKRPREELVEAEAPAADAADASQVDADSTSVVESPEEAAQLSETAVEDYSVDDDLVNDVLGDIFEKPPETPASAEDDSSEARAQEVEEDESALVQAVSEFVEAGDQPDEGEFVESAGGDEVEQDLKEAGDLIEASGEAELADAARPEEGAEAAQAEPPAATPAADPQTPGGDQDDTTGQEMADLLDEINEIDNMLSETLAAGGDLVGDASEPAQAQDAATPDAAKEDHGAAPAEPPEAQAVEEAPDNDVEEQAPAEAAEDTAEAGDSVMAEVDRLLAELGQISLPEEAQDAPDAGAQETVTALEREALLSEEPVDAEEALHVDLAQDVSQEVDRALGEVTRVQQTDGGTSELEIDFTPEGIGIEAEAEPSSEEEENVNDILSSLLAEIDNLDLPEEVDSRPEEAPDEGDGISQLLGGPDAIGDEPPAPAEDRDSKDDDTEEAQEGQAGPADTPEEGSDEAGYDFASELDIDEDELVDQALAEAIGGGDSEDESNYEASDDDFEDDNDDKKDEDDDDADDASDEGPADQEAAMEDDGEALLKNLENSMDSAAADREGEGSAEASAGDAIQQEVVKRSRDIEREVLDEFFGSGAEEFEREIKTEMASIGEEENRDVQDRDDASPESPDDESSVEELPDDSPHHVRLGLLWLAYQMNRPFMRWLSPVRLRNLALLAIGLLSTGFVSLAMALVLLLRGQ